MKLSPVQKRLLARIKRCPKGCYIETRERRTAQILADLGLIRWDGMNAYLKKEDEDGISF